MSRILSTGDGACVAGGVLGRGTRVVGGVCVAGKTAIAPGSTHPTGMHSCYDKFFPVVTKRYSFLESHNGKLKTNKYAF